MNTFYDNSYDKDTDMFMSAMKRIHEDSSLYQQYIKLASNPVWKERFDDFLRGTKTLPLLYDPFFKAIFNADTHRDRLSELISAILGQEVEVVEVIPNEDSTFTGALIIMDIVVKMSDGSFANIEVQKVPYLFPAERISYYSSDLLMRQYTRLKNTRSVNGDNIFSYKDLHHIHTIIFYEKSSEKLQSRTDEKLYFHVGRTVFNTNIDVELLQDFHLISLDTFIKYRYSDIINGDTTVTEYDYDGSVYNSGLSEELKQKRLMYLMLLSTSNVSDMSKLLNLYTELSDIINDINEYLVRPWEVLNMFSEALRILDKNSMDLLIDEMKQDADKARAELNEIQNELSQAHTELNQTQSELDQTHLELNQTQSELNQTQSELNQTQIKLKQAESNLQSEREASQAEIMRLKSELAKFKNI